MDKQPLEKKWRAEESNPQQLHQATVATQTQSISDVPLTAAGIANNGNSGAPPPLEVIFVVNES